jgi:protein-S-isoprenylcysteine O-methyltransferase Ste14
MSSPTPLVIAGCWIAWAAYWLAMSFGTKRTVERGSLLGYRLAALAAFAVAAGVGRLFGLTASSRLWSTGVGLGAVCDLIVIAGAAFTVWARVTLGRNWSAEVTFKEDHELIRSGPYALARHPIYTGILAMVLGTAIFSGRALGAAVALAVCAALWWKVRAEERIMSSHFPDAYAAYRSQVHAIVPFVL